MLLFKNLFSGFVIYIFFIANIGCSENKHSYISEKQNQDSAMQKIIIQTDKAPAPIGPYSQAVMVGNLLFVSGQVAIIPESGKVLQGDIAAETKQVMNNIHAILVQAGMGFENIVKTSIFLKNMDDFAKVNEIYGSNFSGDFPARETVQVSRLPKDVNVEISVIAAK